MTLSTALTTAVSGLYAQSTCISDVSDNLANTSTTGYKKTNTSFSDVVSTLTSTGSDTSGVKASSVNYITSQGTVSSTTSTTDIALTGDGFFPVKAAIQNADGSTSFSDDVYYTRNGDFTLNADGYMVNSAGYYLMAWTVTPATGDVTKTLTPVQITDLTNAAIATSNTSYQANLPSSADVGTTTASSTKTIYDSLGAEHDLVYSWEKTGTNTWNLNVSAADGDYDSATGTAYDYSATIEFTFDTNGKIESIDDSGSNYTVNGDTVSFNLNYNGTAAQTVAADFSGTTQYAATSLSVTSFTQDGVPAGSFNGVSIDTSGHVIINYDNGESKIFYEVPVATFASANNLAKVSGTAFQATLTSGAASYSEAGTEGAGTLSSSALESSTVDVASEFTTMIKAQQVYSANAKTVSTVDSMMKTLFDL